MNLKLYYRSPVMWNLVLYIFLSFVFLYFQYLFIETETILNRITLKDFILGHKLPLWNYVLTCGVILSNKKLFGKILFVTTILLTTIYTVDNILIDFSKFLLIILFIYIIIGYYLYQFYESDCNESYLNPGYSNNLLFDPNLKKIFVKVKNGKSITEGYLTNWSEDSCFIYLNGESDIGKGQVQLEISHLESIFKVNGKVVSTMKNGSGVGIRFENIESEKFDGLGWSHFYEIIEEMGFRPELLK